MHRDRPSAVRRGRGRRIAWAHPSLLTPSASSVRSVFLPKSAEQRPAQNRPQSCPRKECAFNPAQADSLLVSDGGARCCATYCTLWSRRHSAAWLGSAAAAQQSAESHRWPTRPRSHHHGRRREGVGTSGNGRFRGGVLSRERFAALNGVKAPDGDVMTGASKLVRAGASKLVRAGEPAIGQAVRWPLK
jgi:hypothetical protein